MGGSLGDMVKNVISFGAYGQKQAQEEAKKAQQRAEMEARRIAAEKKPMEETATLLTPATNDNPLSSLGLIIEADPTKRKKPTSGLSAPTTSALGFGG